MGTILVGIDGSDDSRVALRWAGRLATLTGRRLILAYAWQHGRPLEGVFGGGAGDPDEIERNVTAALRQIAVEELDDPGVVGRCAALPGPVGAALTKEAARIDAAMIVVGARGAGGARRAQLGSVSRELTASPTQVVAVVPPDETAFEPGLPPVLVGVDGSDGSARAVRWAAELAQQAGSDVVAVHAFSPPLPDLTAAEKASLQRERRQRLEQEWCAPLRAAGVAHRPMLEPGDPRHVVRGVADEVRPLAGVFGSRGLGAFASRLLGSVTGHLVRELAWPVVVIPSPRHRLIWPPVRPARGHRLAPHTADWRIEAWGPTRAACAEEAVLALVESFAAASGAAATTDVPVSVGPAADDDLLALLLEEVVYLVETQGAVPVTVELADTGDGTLAGVLRTTMVGSVQPVGPVPKGVSRASALRREEEGWRADVIIDV